MAVLTYNSEKTLGQCLDSLTAFEEIIICDGGSTDNTRAIAEKYGARIIDQDPTYKHENGSIKDFSGIRNQTLDAASHDWFLFIDSDEYISKELEEEIRNIVAIPITKESPLAYWMPRKRVYQDAIVDCTTTYPSYQMRFFNRKGAQKFIKAVHERIQLIEGTKTAYLTHPEYVPFDFTKEAWKKKLSYYIQIEVDRHKEQTFLNWLHMTFNSIKVSILFVLRHIRMTLFCRGHKMPLWYELMQHWYHLELITRTGKKFFKR